MLFPTLTPESASHLYMMTAFILNALGAQPIISLIHARWLVKRNYKLMPLSTLFKGIIVIWGFFLISLNHLFQRSFFINITYIMIGLIIGYICFYFEKISIRYYLRFHLLKNKKISEKNNLGSLLSSALFEPTHLQLSSNTANKTIRESGIRRGSNNMLMSSETYQFSLLSLILTAIFEEFIFRGFLLVLCLELSSPLSIIFSIIILNVLFGFLHYNFGALHVVLKIIFSFCMLGCVFITGNLFTAIAAHLFFNILTWRFLKGRSVIDTRHRSEHIAILG